MLITFEGIDGCGKTTQMKRLADTLYRDVINTREPGFPKDSLSGIYRHLIMEGDTCPVEKMFLLLADRTRHFNRFIKPIMEETEKKTMYGARKVTILSDRGPDSTVAYQGFGAGIAPIPFLVEANRIATSLTPISLTIILDVSIEEAARRVTKPQYFEGLGAEFMKRVRAGYLEIAKYEPQRVALINATQSEEEVHKSIMRVVQERLKG